MNEKQDRKHGLTRTEWLKLYEDAGWKAAIVNTCHEVAVCEHANPSTRVRALEVWGNLLTVGLTPIIPPDDRSYPQVVRDVQLEIVCGRKGALDERVRDQMDERMDGVMMTMSTIAGFLDHGAIHALADAIMQGEQRQSPGGN